MDALTRGNQIRGKLVGFATGSAGSNLEMTPYMAGLLEDAGVRVEVITAPCGTKANLFATSVAR